MYYVVKSGYWSEARSISGKFRPRIRTHIRIKMIWIRNTARKLYMSKIRIPETDPCDKPAQAIAKNPGSDNFINSVYFQFKAKAGKDRVLILMHFIILKVWHLRPCCRCHRYCSPGRLWHCDSQGPWWSNRPEQSLPRAEEEGWAWSWGAGPGIWGPHCNWLRLQARL